MKIHGFLWLNCTSLFTDMYTLLRFKSWISLKIIFTFCLSKCLCTTCLGVKKKKIKIPPSHSPFHLWTLRVPVSSGPILPCSLSAHELLRRQRAEYRTARTLRADSDSAFSYFRVLSRKDREVVFSSACPLWKQDGNERIKRAGILRSCWVTRWMTERCFGL